RRGCRPCVRAGAGAGEARRAVRPVARGRAGASRAGRVTLTMLSISRAMQQLAEAAPDRPAITCGATTVTRGELESRTNRLARAYAEAASGDAFGRMVTVALPNGIEFFEACTAIWKLGGTPHLVSARMPAAEQGSLIELADPVLVVGEAPAGERPHVPAGFAVDPGGSDAPLPDAVSP